MDTNSNIPAQKKVVSVEILHLNELSYGPQRKHTRREWRNECLENLLAGASAFNAWQNSWKNQIKIIDDTKIYPGFSGDLIYVDKEFTIVNDHPQPFANNLNHGLLGFSLDFMGHKFDSDLDLSGYEFHEDTIFAYAIFCKNINFSNAKFHGNALFQNTLFNNNVYFTNTSFNIANFRETRFYCDAIYRNTSFQNVDFLKARFLAQADFFKASFEDFACFDEVVFSKKQATSFYSCEFKDDASFKQCNFLGNTYFNNAIFNGDVEFNFSIFKKDIRFFKTQFFGGIFFQNTNFTGNAVKRLGILKKIAEDNGQFEQALDFNALELKAKREDFLTPKSFKIITFLYEILSDYGRSYLRPILSYFILFIISVLLVIIVTIFFKNPVEDQQILCKSTKDQPQLKLSYERAVFEYTMFRAGGLMDFTDTGKQNNAVNCRLFEEPIEPSLMRAWGIFKGIASIALLFLAALGLRNKYRIK